MSGGELRQARSRTLYSGALTDKQHLVDVGDQNLRRYYASVACSGGRHASTRWVSPGLRLSGLAPARRPSIPARPGPPRYGDDCRQAIGSTPSRAAELPCRHGDAGSPTGRASINQRHAKTTDAALHKSAACVAGRAPGINNHFDAVGVPSAARSTTPQSDTANSARRRQNIKNPDLNHKRELYGSDASTECWWGESRSTTSATASYLYRLLRLSGLTHINWFHNRELKEKNTILLYYASSIV